MRFGPRLRPTLLAGLALLLYWLMAVSVSPRMGVTADEVVHLTGGFTYWKYNDYRLHPENGTLPMRLAALPWLADEVKAPPLTDRFWLGSKVNLYGYDLFYRNGNPVDKLLWRSRMLIALTGVLTIWLTWRWARGLFGPAAGWVALLLSIFCPAMLAHGGLATSDMGMTLCVLVALTLGWRLLHRASWSRLLATGVACGLAFLSKMSGVLIVPLLGAMLALRVWRGSPLVLDFGRQARWLRRRGQIATAGTALLLASAALSLVVLWAGYGFRYSGFNDTVSAHEDYYFSWDIILDKTPIPRPNESKLEELRGEHAVTQETSMTHVIAWMRDRHLLPEAYLWGFAHTYKFSRHRPAYFLGQYRTQGWRTFFPVAFLLKTTLPALALIGVGVFTLLGSGRGAMPRTKPWLYRAAPLLLFFTAYWIMAINLHLNIGHRHILPTYPVFYVLASSSALWLASRWRRLALLALGAALLLHATDSWQVRPFYLAYFTPAVGGTERGYHYLVDSSYDWGQGLPDLDRWLREKKARGDRTPVHLTYFGADSPRYRDLDVIRFGDDINDSGTRTYPAHVGGGWFVISATDFVRVYLPTRGPWIPANEELYLRIQTQLGDYGRNGFPSGPEGPQQVLHLAQDYEALQFARLCAYLGNREPNTIIGGCMLAFLMSDAEVARALYGPAPYPSPAR